MYQIMHFTPPAPSTKNPELPEMVDLIVSKALKKPAEERYQDAKDLVQDLRECAEMLTGKSSGPQGSNDSAPASARRADRLAAVKPGQATIEEDARGLALAKSFDSYEATMRLATLTGAERELETFSATQGTTRVQGGAGPTPGLPTPAAATSRPSASATGFLQDPKGPPVKGRVGANASNYTYLWIVSALAVAVAVALYLLR
jgi:hypothetical protein